uniref:Galectin n=1 Tax=Electrophorus electricus TaxID=8005 RepID=A0A4W4DM07_ELEEL
MGFQKYTVHLIASRCSQTCVHHFRLEQSLLSLYAMFEINFLCDRDDRIAFRFKLHFTKSDIICNSFTGNCWGQEKSSSNFHFSTDEPFQVEIYSNNDYFHIYFADTFLLEHVTSLQIVNVTFKLKYMFLFNVSPHPI